MTSGGPLANKPGLPVSIQHPRARVLRGREPLPGDGWGFKATWDFGSASGGLSFLRASPTSQRSGTKELLHSREAGQGSIMSQLLNTKLLRSVLGLTAFCLFNTVFARDDTPKGADAKRNVPLPTVDILFRPLRGEGGQVKAIEVRIELPKGLAGKEMFSIMAPIVYVGVVGIADRITELKVQDANGEVKLNTRDDEKKPGGFPYFRHWVAERKVIYPLVITYRSSPEPTPPVRGPQFSFRRPRRWYQRCRQWHPGVA